MIDGTDLALVYVPNGGSWRDLSKFLPLGSIRSCPASLLYKTSEGKLKKGLTRVDPKRVCTYKSFDGYEYKLDFPTFNGLCMAVLVSQNKAPCILGFHLGGILGQGHSVAGSLTLDQYLDAKHNLGIIPGVILCKDSGNLPTEQYGVQFYEGPKLHARSPVAFLEKGCSMEFYGQCAGRSTPKSDVRETPISSIVHSVCGVPQQWGAPKMHPWKPWRDTLIHAVNPTVGLPVELLQRAVLDYKAPLLEKLEQSFLRMQIAPLTEMQTVCGIDGKRFIDKMPPNTSVGYPLQGPKSQFLTYYDPEDYPDFNCPAMFDEFVMDEIKKYKDTYISGERVYPIFKASLKDEPTKLTKDKVRVFQAAPVAFQFLVRQYFLPVARLLSIYPLISECAVGVNAQGPEWDQLAKHMNKFGKDRILAGDYSKYDLRMPAQTMFAAFDIMIDIARQSGNYTEDDISIMHGIATDVCYPLVAYNGDLIQLFGSNPSGQNLTVYVNSIVNSLNLRCGFFQMYPKHTNFRSVCSFMTYGDDVKGSVKSGFDDFNHISFAQFLGKYGMVFTMPDKESAPVKFMTDSDADFLKRKNVWDNDLDMYRGALDESSIFKSLHSVIKSKSITLKEQSMQTIDGALREWAMHGRETYEMRRSQMQKVASEAGIAHGCRELDITYDERIAAFLEKYEI
jgi:hypothetical protein